MARAESGTTIGTLGSPWRATVTGAGSVIPWPDTPGEPLEWWIGSDDRWHVPALEPTLRQERIEGTPVVETAIRVPSGDAVQRLYAVADHGGLTVMDIENRSPLPFAVATNGKNLLSSRPPGEMTAEARAAAGEAGVPRDVSVHPVAHRTTLRLVLPHAPDALPSGMRTPPSLAPIERVVHGWRELAERGLRLVLPSDELTTAVRAARCDLLLEGLAPWAESPAEFLIGAEVMRVAGDELAAVEEVGAAAERLLRAQRRRRGRGGSDGDRWLARAGLRAAEVSLTRRGERRASRDARSALSRIGEVEAPPSTELAGVALIARLSEHLVAPTEEGADLAPDLPPDWFGASVEAHRIPVPLGEVSVAIRWHGARPALLWESTAPMVLTASALDPAWRAEKEATRRGEALLAAPIHR